MSQAVGTTTVAASSSQVAAYSQNDAVGMAMVARFSIVVIWWRRRARFIERERRV